MVREKTGASEVPLELPPGSSVAVVRDALSRRFGIPDILGKCAWAVNQEYASIETPLQDGDEIAVIPAVSGG